MDSEWVLRKDAEVVIEDLRIQKRELKAALKKAMTVLQYWAEFDDTSKQTCCLAEIEEVNNKYNKENDQFFKRVYGKR